MNSELFYELKDILCTAIIEEMAKDFQNHDSYKTLLKILSDITFENRKNENGRLSHFIVDSYTGNKELGSRLIDFDNRL